MTALKTTQWEATYDTSLFKKLRPVIMIPGICSIIQFLLIKTKNPPKI